MKCSEVQERLSLFYDHQLSQEEAARIEAHATDCSSCKKELASFQQLSRLSQQLTDPLVPTPMWEELQSKFNQPPERKTVPTRNFRNEASTRRLALAATILVALGIGAIAYPSWLSSEANHLAINFAHYLEEFSEQPDAAQQILLAKYHGQPTTLEKAEKVLGYKPVAAKGLPPGYALKEVHLLTLPCCTCTQVICTNQAGKSIAIFEHAIDQPVWFGDRPTEECVCHNVPTSIRQAGNQLAATWQEGKRHITIIGATDLDEVTQFVAHFKGASSG